MNSNWKHRIQFLLCLLVSISFLLVLPGCGQQTVNPPETKPDYEIGSETIDKASGTGKAFYKSGKLLYEGEFKEDKFDGKGKLYFENGQLRYDGQFKNDMFNGKGTAYNEGGKKIFEGEFKDGKALLK